VWKTRWTVGKIIYLAFRYGGMGIHAFDTFVYVNTSAGLNFCKGAIHAQTAGSAAVLWAADVILAARVWIMYSKSKKILISLTVLFAASLITYTVLDSEAFRGTISQSPLPPPYGSGCDTIGLPLPTFLFTAIIPPLFTTCVLFALTVAKTIRAVLAQRTPTLTLILRDGALYFLVTLSCLVINAIIFRTARLSMKGSASGFLTAIPWVMTCRMMLNIRGLIVHPCISEDIELSNRSSVRFRSTGATEAATESDPTETTSGYPETPTQIDHSTRTDHSMDRQDYASSSTQPLEPV